MARAMKDSGIPWIGEIPENWTVKKLKYCSTVLSGYPFESANFTNTNGFPLIRIRDITSGEIETYYLGEYDPTFIVRKNDILIGMDGDFNVRWWNNVDALLNQRCCKITPLQGYSKRYLFYCLPLFLKRINDLTYSTTVKHLSVGDIFNSFIPDISLNEQSRIVASLDTECARIDAVMEQTRASIEEYKKLKQSIITEAVTKGIRPNRPMKDSGISWIGLIPEDWKVLGLRYLCEMQSGKNLASESIAAEGEYPVYGGNGHRGYYSEYNTEGDYLLVGRQGALCGNVHRVSGQFWATEHAVVTTPTALSDIGFLYYLLIGMNLNQYVNNTAAQPGLAVSQLQGVRTCLIPLQEQREIAQYLDEKCVAIDDLLIQKTTFIAELETYKKSLIYEYVTGKKEA